MHPLEAILEMIDVLHPCQRSWRCQILCLNDGLTEYRKTIRIEITETDHWQGYVHGNEQGARSDWRARDVVKFAALSGAAEKH